MKNITLTVSEEVALWARVWAARHNTSVSRMCGEMLQERMEKERTYEASMRAFLEQGPVGLKSSGGYPSRGEVHERK